VANKTVRIYERLNPDARLHISVAISSGYIDASALG
jgi:hypothetical protein